MTNTAQDVDTPNPARPLVEGTLKAPTDADNLATIRELLFGEQVRDAEQKRQDLHQDLKSDLSLLQQESRAQFEQISADVQTLYRLLNDETEQRHSNESKTQQQVESLQSSLKKSNTLHSKAHDALQLKMNAETTRLEQQAKLMNDDISAKLERAAKELKSDKTDRGDLAQLLQGMAEQLLEEQKS